MKAAWRLTQFFTDQLSTLFRQLHLRGERFGSHLLVASPQIFRAQACDFLLACRLAVWLSAG
jgi:hypothetical protein